VDEVSGVVVPPTVEDPLPVTVDVVANNVDGSKTPTPVGHLTTVTGVKQSCGEPPSAEIEISAAVVAVRPVNSIWNLGFCPVMLTGSAERSQYL
jgi:hypothetical protein